MRHLFVMRVLTTIGICSALGLLTGGIWLVKNAARGNPLDWGAILVPEILFWNGWGAVAPVVFWLCGQLPLRLATTSWRLILHLPAALVLPLCGYGLALALQGAGRVLLGAEVDAVFADLRGRFEGHYIYGIGFIFGCLIYGLTASAAYARSYYSGFRREALRRSQLEAQLAAAQLQALKMQLHPHFFFNTLNSISSLLHRDVQAADSMLAKLGDFLRLTLDQHHLEQVALAAEFEFVRRYMEIEQIRFGDRLSVSLDASPEALGASVPNLLLQPLVENAVGHGVAQSIAEGRIEVSARVQGGRLQVGIADSGPGLVAGVQAKGLFDKGIGLANTRARLTEHYGTEFSLDLRNGPLGGLQVSLEIPYGRYGGEDAAG